MDTNRESVILIKGKNFKEDEAKCHITWRYDAGTVQCNQRIEEHKALGLESGDNCLVITHDFETEEAAQQAVTKILELKSVIPPINKLELVKAVGKTLVAKVGINEITLAQIPYLSEFASYVGDLANINQFFVLDLKISRDLKEIFCDSSGSPLALALDSLCLKLVLSARKETPMKIADFVATRLPPSEQPQVKLIGRCAAAFHHLMYTIDLKALNAERRAIGQELFATVFKAGVQSFYQGCVQLGLLEMFKTGEPTTKLTFCLSPLLSSEFTMYSLNILEVLQTLGSVPAANPERPLLV